MFVPLLPDDDHISLNRTIADGLSESGSVDHGAGAHVDAAVRCARADISGLRIGDARPAHESSCGTETGMYSGNAVAYKSRTVLGIWTDRAPLIGLSQFLYGSCHYCRTRLTSSGTAGHFL